MGKARKQNFPKKNASTELQISPSKKKTENKSINSQNDITTTPQNNNFSLKSLSQAAVLKHSSSSFNRVLSGKISKKPSHPQIHSNKQKLSEILAYQDALTMCNKIKAKLIEGEGHDGNQIETTPISSSRKLLKSQVRPKKMRRLVKKDAFIKKIDMLIEAEKSKMEAKKREKTVIVGDMKPILDALTEVQTMDTNTSEPSLKNSKDNNKKTNVKKRNEEIAQGLNYFAASMNTFQRN